MILQLVVSIIWLIMNCLGLLFVLDRYVYKRYSVLGNIFIFLGFIGSFIGLLFIVVVKTVVIVESMHWFKYLTKTHKIKE